MAQIIAGVSDARCRGMSPSSLGDVLDYLRRRAPRRSSAFAKIVVVIFGLAAWSTSASAFADGQWGWFLAVSQIDKWFVLQGKATVTVAGGRFKAELTTTPGFTLPRWRVRIEKA